MKIGTAVPVPNPMHRPRGYKVLNLTEDRVVSIGSVSKKVRAAKNPELVPRNYLPKEIPAETLKDLKWMMQKGTS